MNRRGFLKACLAAAAAPAFVRSESLMVLPQKLVTADELLTGFGLAAPKAEGAVIAYEHVQYALGFTITDKALWPGINRFWHEHYDKYVIGELDAPKR